MPSKDVAKDEKPIGRRNARSARKVAGTAKQKTRSASMARSGKSTVRRGAQFVKRTSGESGHLADGTIDVDRKYGSSKRGVGMDADTKKAEFSSDFRIVRLNLVARSLTLGDSVSHDDPTELADLEEVVKSLNDEFKSESFGLSGTGYSSESVQKTIKKHFLYGAGVRVEIELE